MFRHLIRREKNRKERFNRSGLIKGQPNDLYQLQDRARFVAPRFEISIVQPGLSRAAVSPQQLELLASTEVYLHEVAMAELTVFCSD